MVRYIFLNKLFNFLFSKNQIEVIEEETFKEQKDLEQLYLADNKISLLTPDTFAGLSNLGVNIVKIFTFCIF